MNNNWIVVSVVSGIVIGSLVWLLSEYWELGVIAAVMTCIIVIINNPERRFLKVFWALLSSIFILNKFFFKIVGSISGNYFKVGADTVDSSVTIALCILAGLSLILDYQTRGDKPFRLKSLFNFQWNISKVGKIQGKGHTIIINTNTSSKDKNQHDNNQHQQN